MTKDALNDLSASAWSHWKRDIGVSVWTSFVAACLGTIAFFGYFDPLMQGSDELPALWLAHRPVTYTAGFLLLWALTIGATAFNALFLCSAQVSVPKHV